MQEVWSNAELWADITVFLICFICPAVAVSCWLYHLNRLKQAKGMPKTKRTTLKTISIGILMYALEVFVFGRSGRGYISWVHRREKEVKKLKRQTEIETLKKRPCEAKLPDAPRWHCGCGRINPAHTATCVCGRNMRDIPMGHRYPAEKPSTWHCACGREVPVYTSTCVCGRNKPTAIQPKQDQSP